jgi:hypothetical protein
MTIKEHFEKNKKLYIGVGIGLAVGLGLAGGTCLIMRAHSGSTIMRDTIVHAKRDTIVLGKKSTLNQVSYISSNRQGPPSWVVQCKETGGIFSSQASAAAEMGLSTSRLSQHLNGVTDHVNGFHFERICLAA